MTKIKEFLKSPKATLFLALVAVALLLTGTIGGSRAALTYFSENYTSRVEMFDIGVSLLENGKKVSWRDYIPQSDGKWNENIGVLLEDMIDEGEYYQAGQPYREEIAVENSGTIDEYVRVILYKYWVNEEGEKLRNMDPSLITLNLVNLTSEGGPWVLDEKSTTDERTVLYYNTVLPTGEQTVSLSDSLTISPDVVANAEPVVSEKVETRDGRQCKVITTTYSINGMKFQLEAEVDAVQTHNAAPAIRSAWGIDPAIVGLSETADEQSEEQTANTAEEG